MFNSHVFSYSFWEFFSTHKNSGLSSGATVADAADVAAAAAADVVVDFPELITTENSRQAGRRTNWVVVVVAVNNHHNKYRDRPSPQRLICILLISALFECALSVCLGRSVHLLLILLILLLLSSPPPVCLYQWLQCNAHCTPLYDHHHHHHHHHVIEGELQSFCWCTGRLWNANQIGAVTYSVCLWWRWCLHQLAYQPMHAVWVK